MIIQAWNKFHQTTKYEMRTRLQILALLPAHLCLQLASQPIKNNDNTIANLIQSK
jgi:hypothetical protein